MNKPSRKLTYSLERSVWGGASASMDGNIQCIPGFVCSVGILKLIAGICLANNILSTPTLLEEITLMITFELISFFYIGINYIID